MGVDFKNIDNDEKEMFYEEWIYNEICESLFLWSGESVVGGEGKAERLKGQQIM